MHFDCRNAIDLDQFSNTTDQGPVADAALLAVLRKLRLFAVEASHIYGIESN
jgi:hypothetical protein